VFPNDPDVGHFQTIRQAIQQKSAFGFLSETVFTLEAIQKASRKAFIGASKLKSKSTIEEQKDGRIHLGMVFGPDPSHHAANNSYLSKHLQDARALNFKLLRCPRFGGFGNPDLQASDYADDDRFTISVRQERIGKCANEIETHGWGIKQIKDIGNKYAKGRRWLDGVMNAPASEDGVIAKAVAEWADGDAVAAHYGYGNDYFCTRDKAKAAGVNSVMSPQNRAHLLNEYNIQFVSPEELAKKLTT
jgi:hypothetical protein